jgi:hypothetical protein
MSGVPQEVTEHALNIKPGSKRSSKAYDASIRRSTGPWVKTYRGFWLLVL